MVTVDDILQGTLEGTRFDRNYMDFEAMVQQHGFTPVVGGDGPANWRLYVRQDGGSDTGTKADFVAFRNIGTHPYKINTFSYEMLCGGMGSLETLSADLRTIEEVRSLDGMERALLPLREWLGGKKYSLSEDAAAIWPHYSLAAFSHFLTASGK